jgi:hypothetical protein
MRWRGVVTIALTMVASLAWAHPAAAIPIATSSDYGPAEWVPASSANYSVANRPHDYQVNLIVIHDIEGSVDSAITAFQDPNRAGSAHYIVGQLGGLWQMVAEKDIAWHAGNWDYNTGAIGIEHEGCALCNNYTAAEYRTSAQLSASICSRWGVPLDRSHVIGHSEVPDPNNPGLYGGSEHHTDPGPYWDWTGYMSLAQSYAAGLPSPPHMGPDPIAAAEEGGVIVSWQPAQSCHDPIRSYTVVGQPGNIAVTLPARQTSVWIPGLTDGTSYTFTVTATNPEGQSSLTTNASIPGAGCATAGFTASPPSPQPVGTSITVTARSTGCNTPEYAFWLRLPDGTWLRERDYARAATWTLNTAALSPGSYELGIWARQVSSSRSNDAYAFAGFQLGGSACLSASLTPGAAPPRPSGTVVTFTAASSGCSSPQYRFWILPPGGSWTSVQPYGAGTTWAFDSSKYGSGNFQVGVWVRQAGSTSSYDAFYVTSYWIQSGAGCVVSGLTPSVASPQAVGAPVTFTPQQSGCTNQYRFWLLPPGGSWRVMQDYGAGATWAWNTAGYAPGTYEVGVWEGRSSAPGAYESYAITSFTLEVPTCTSASLSSDLSGPQPPGATITFTATSTGCASPQYEFWLLAPNGAWTMKHAYGGATWSWNTTGLAPGTYQVGVWARQAGSAASYDAYYIGTYRVAGPTCSSPTLTASPASSQPAGTPVTFTATAAGCASPQYEFWEQPSGGAWSVVQPYSAGATFTWNGAGGAGAYNFAVWVLAPGSVSDYDAYRATGFSLS